MSSGGIDFIKRVAEAAGEGFGKLSDAEKRVLRSAGRALQAMINDGSFETEDGRNLAAAQAKAIAKNLAIIKGIDAVEAVKAALEDMGVKALAAMLG